MLLDAEKYINKKYISLISAAGWWRVPCRAPEQQAARQTSSCCQCSGHDLGCIHSMSPCRPPHLGGARPARQGSCCKGLGQCIGCIRVVRAAGCRTSGQGRQTARRLRAGLGRTRSMSRRRPPHMSAARARQDRQLLLRSSRVSCRHAPRFASAPMLLHDRSSSYAPPNASESARQPERAARASAADRRPR